MYTDLDLITPKAKWGYDTASTATLTFMNKLTVEFLRGMTQKEGTHTGIKTFTQLSLKKIDRFSSLQTSDRAIRYQNVRVAWFG